MALNTAIVGCGAVAQRLYRKPLQLLETQKLLQVTALVDPVAEHIASLHGFFPNARTYASLDDVYEAVAPALTLILSPAQWHCRHAIQALQHGSHVLCEKPMGATAAECARMNVAAATADRVLAVGMIRRFFPAYAELHRLLTDGRLGSVLSFEYREGHKFDWDVTTPAAFRPRSQGGTGVLFDIGPHVLDFLDWLFGPLAVVDYSDDALGGIETNLVMELATQNGRGVVHLSWDQPQVNELRVRGTEREAVVRVDRFDQLAVRESSLFERQPVALAYAADVHPTPRRRVSPRSYSDAMYCQLVQVVRSIELGERPAADGAAGERCVSMLDSALAIATPLDAPWLDFAQQQASRRLHWSVRA